MRARDTSEAAADLQARFQSSIPPGERVLRCLETSDFAREFARSALRVRYPSLTEEQINSELIVRLYGLTRSTRER